MAGELWGVDSAAEVTAELYDCVLKTYGKPSFWGRYLVTVSGASEGLTSKEIDYLHTNKTKVMPIFNNFTSATGRHEGQVSGQNAIYHARRLRFPKGIVLFANVEKFFEIDKEWLIGWFDSIYKSDYKPGFYFDPKKGNFENAYCTAVRENGKIGTHSVLWSGEPELGVTKARNAPRFNPEKPACQSNVWGWQYGRNAKSCPIDTNLIKPQLNEMLW